MQVPLLNADFSAVTPMDLHPLLSPDEEGESTSQQDMSPAVWAATGNGKVDLVRSRWWWWWWWQRQMWRGKFQLCFGGVRAGTVARMVAEVLRRGVEMRWRWRDVDGNSRGAVALGI